MTVHDWPPDADPAGWPVCATCHRTIHPALWPVHLHTRHPMECVYLCAPETPALRLWRVTAYPVPAGAHVPLGRYPAYTPEEALANASKSHPTPGEAVGWLYLVSDDPGAPVPSTTADLPTWNEVTA